jgi:hypothetical protein
MDEGQGSVTGRDEGLQCASEFMKIYKLTSRMRPFFIDSRSNRRRDATRDCIGSYICLSGEAMTSAQMDGAIESILLE